ncbi:proteasome regulatory particle base subunit RPN10 [Kluyveromyces lactis]|uniref:KLLA0B03916p n=1 Tax=Kluyveromyces lactis (strain ATCC 8585 / CBS 2359 / DSM 70799 / NBRC 1267 / NRRL Y-1140 / WM37) TaxID=284590 RepID=Q6CWI1_KLULA|nr:uncharacterized protein KLLA0_B03916g [Kluyveromyces lactis]CAH02101.1 KLLA0B03916p [Kluyveromyces lactis]|eukprot:XP_451708.1 uncharacterized protein KLLA0_B03916g [Kluyveromyces lactis]
MVLEATVLVVDNSEYARNGDFPRTRFVAQVDAVEYIFQAKRNSNPENTIGLVSAAEANPKVLSTFTNEFGKILSGLHDINIGGSIHFATAIQIAALTLKHRQNRVQRQRIIIFVCSPITEDRQDLIKMAKKLKKNSIAVDVINFGETDTNADLLEEFVETVNSGQEDSKSTLLNIDAGPKLLYEHVAASPIVLEGPAAEAGFSMGGNDDFMDFGVDPSLDPELAMALRLSMQEEQERQERIRQNSTE